MHELPVTQSILNICLKHAMSYGVQKIMAIHLEIGEMSDLEDDWMQQYFDYVSKGTPAEGARLKIKRIPVVMRCNACGESFKVDMKKTAGIQCPKCSAEKNHTLVSGKEYHIKNMEAI
jgi:hydrogenase nickel incorporation protein HypA/HybF